LTIVDGYPKSISKAPATDGIPNETGITAAFYDNNDNKTYFFKDDGKYFLFPDDIVAYYPFNGNANDASGNSHNGTERGATLAADRFSNAKSAYHFDKEKKHYIKLVSASKLGLNGNFTVSAWIKVSTGALESKKDLPILGADEEESLHLIIRNKKIYMGFGGSNNISGPETEELTADDWYCLTYRYDNTDDSKGDSKGECTLFINGDEKAREPNNNNPRKHNRFEGKGTVNIGRWDGQYFDGNIDEVRIYNRALTDEEIKQLSRDRQDINSFLGEMEFRNNIQTNGNVDAAFSYGGKTYLFSGDQYYRYLNTEFNKDPLNDPFYVDFCYPRLLKNNQEGLPQWSGPIRAAFVWKQKIYLFSETQYVIFNPDTSSSSKEKNIAHNWQWPDGFDNFDAAFNFNDKVCLIAKDEDQKDQSDKKYKYICVDNFVNVDNAKYDIIRLSSMTGSKLSQALFARGLDDLFGLKNQEIDELPIFKDDNVKEDAPKNDLGNSIIKVNAERVEIKNLPVHSHLEFLGANSLHYWELFFHAPLLIAKSLNTQQKFKDAKKWFEYIFDPTDEFEYWKFLPFLAVDIKALIQRLETHAQNLNPKPIIDLLKPYVEVFKGEYELPKISLANLFQKEEAFENLRTEVTEIVCESDAKKNLSETLDTINELTSYPNIDTSNIDTLISQLRTNGQTLNLDVTRVIDLLKSYVLAKLKNNTAFIGFKTQVEGLSDANAKKSLSETLDIIARLYIRYELMLKNYDPQIRAYLEDPSDPHAIAQLRRIAYRRTTVMAYIDNLIDWGDQLFRQYTHETINEARMHYVLAYDLLGQKPENTGTRILPDALSYKDIPNAEADKNRYNFMFDVKIGGAEKDLTFAAKTHSSVGSPYFYIPENKNLIEYWDRIEDQLHKIRHCLNIMGLKQPLPLFQPPIDPMALVRAAASGAGMGGAIAGLSIPVPHYRFTFMVKKAQELVEKLNKFGESLLSALEKKDSEALSLLQNRHEKEILEITYKIKEAQLNEASENLKSLEENYNSAKTQKDHYDDLIEEGLIVAEEAQIGLMGAAVVLYGVSTGLKIASAFGLAAPDVAIGIPFASHVKHGGSNIGDSLNTASEVSSTLAETVSMGGEIAGIYAQHQRSVEEWELQQKIATSEMTQLAAQIEGAKYQIKAAQLELKSTDQEIKQNESMNRFMQNKFSNEQLYQWMTSKLAGLFFQAYKLAHDMAKAAEKAYQFERGLKEREVAFIGGMYWDSLRKGLLSGDSLGHDLDRMEKAYLDTNSRALEIGKHMSLAELDPMAFIQLKTKGVCEFHLSEALFDYDFPGHYCRQVKTIAIEINAGKGKTVNATLTQLRHKTVMEADVKAVKFLLNPQGKEPLSIRSNWRIMQQIALGDIGQYDEPNGLFELKFDYDRYLPFEGTGAVSSWRLELSGKRGSYSLNDLNKVLIKLKYTALNGGSAFAGAVKGLLKPYTTAVYLNLAVMFPNEWHAFRYNDTEDLNIRITRDMLPNLSGSKITGLVPHYEPPGSPVSLILNDDTDLTLKHGKKIDEPTGLMVRSTGAIWNFKAKGDKKNLSNLGLVVMYKAIV
jgi:hypothetical protein